MATLEAMRILGVVVLELLFAGAVGGQARDRAESAQVSRKAIVLRVFDVAVSRLVVHPLVCVREIDQSIGAVGDSLGWVSVGGHLPNGALHLRIISPRHHPADTVVTWPPAADAKPVVVRLRPRDGTPSEPRCPTAR